VSTRTTDRTRPTPASSAAESEGTTADSSTSRQQAVGSGASNQNNTAQVNGSGFTAIDRDNAVISFTAVW
jgi:hypothetical protein